MVSLRPAARLKPERDRQTESTKLINYQSNWKKNKRDSVTEPVIWQGGWQTLSKLKICWQSYGFAPKPGDFELYSRLWMAADQPRAQREPTEKWTNHETDLAKRLTETTGYLILKWKVNFKIGGLKEIGSVNNLLRKRFSLVICWRRLCERNASRGFV